MSNDRYQPEDDRPHVDTDTCGKCRKKFEKGHRVVITHIVESTHNNLQNLGQKGLYLFREYELSHRDCNDPFLKKGPSNG